MLAHTFRARNFRVLEPLEWSPSGLCLLCGPNGSGKSTTLDVLLFLRTLFERGLESALSAVQGQYFRSLDAPEDEPVEFEVEVGELLWRLRFPMSVYGLRGAYGEELLRAGQPILRAGMFDEGWYLGGERRDRDELRCCARVLWDSNEAQWMRPLADALAGIRVYKSYWLNQVQQPQQTFNRDSYLSMNGRNLWAVLANWRSAPSRHGHNFEWVMSIARSAFPSQITTIDFDNGIPYILGPRGVNSEMGLPASRAAEGLLTGLLHLAAIAGSRPGATIAIDEMENQLHPHAIRLILAAMRDKAEERELTIVLTTHSPVVMNSFRDQPEQVYVLERSARPFPASMAALHSEEWLAQAKLGSLYERLAFAAPLRDEPRS